MISPGANELAQRGVVMPYSIIDLSYAPVPMDGDATALAQHTKK